MRKQIALLFGLGVALAPGVGATAADVQAQIAVANQAAGDDPALQQLAALFCADPKAQPGRGGGNEESAGDPQKTYQEPMQVFDNLYFLGNKRVNAWAVTTSAGIILIDSLHASEVQDQIVGGMAKLGLDPKQIKYVLLSHGHGDHIGGAKFLQATYGTRIVMSAADWDYAEARLGNNPEDPPRRDMIAGDHLTLGDTTITIIPTPGHTPGTLSFLLPVRDHGVPHVAVMGGGGKPNGTAGAEPSLDAMKEFIRSIDVFSSAAAKADAQITNHPAQDGSIEKLRILKTRTPDQPHPFLIDPALQRRRLTIVSACMKAAVARRETP